VLPAAHRLRRSSDFQLAARRGRRVTSPTVLLHAVTRPGGGLAQVGFVVSRSVGSAVVRNRVKRRLRAAVRPRLDDVAGWLLVFRARPDAANADYARLQADVDRCCAQLSATSAARQVEEVAP
jgi:ribonuclease P protein component